MRAKSYKLISTTYIGLIFLAILVVYCLYAPIASRLSRDKVPLQFCEEHNTLNCKR